MKADAVLLDEVVAIGYATVKRKDLTGSVASVNSKELSKVPTSDITQALAGRMAGVQVMQSEGAPGASISIRVRGGISITQSNEPLYIIDGVPTKAGMHELNSSDIESIQVLKDASSGKYLRFRVRQTVLSSLPPNKARKENPCRLNAGLTDFMVLLKDGYAQHE